ncbi:hypothetical protein protein, putative [Babesia ovis]|uniref:RNA-editing substrate-binding complex 6 protein domain-containing protein n=1 Tax=Babesia ovis TaxID=5869 RepID=A0A9W5T8T5_BABOV|nr:hypothetical protein protein, putative [Babesia ovis]
MVVTVMLRPLVCRAFVRYQSTAPSWLHSRTVGELVHALQRVEHLDNDELALLEDKSQQLLSDDMREASMLALTLHNFGGNAQQLLTRVEVRPDDANIDIFYRTLAECGVTEPPKSLSDVLDSIEGLENIRQIYNFFCAACIFKEHGDTLAFDSLVERLHLVGFTEFSSLQLLQMASGLAVLSDDNYGSLLESLCDELSVRKLMDININDLIDGMSKLSKYYLNEALLKAFEETISLHCTEGLLSPYDICSVLYIFSRYRKCDSLLMDRLAVMIRRDVGNYDIAQLSRVILSLSQIGYYNKPLVALIGRMVLTLIDPEAILDTQLLTNLYTGFSRFHHHNKLFETFSAILQKEEVFAELQVHDAVAIVQSYARIHTVDERLFRLFDSKLFCKPLNTTLSQKLLVAHGKLRYNNTRLQNILVNNINLKEIGSTIDREKLKLAAERLGLFFPELTDDGEEDAIPRITWRRMVPLRRKLPHVRRRKWTW